MNKQHVELVTFLKRVVVNHSTAHNAALYTGIMVRNIMDHAELWQAAQDAYGEGAEGLMSVASVYARSMASYWEALQHPQHRATWGHLVDCKEENEETRYLWCVVERFGLDLMALVVNHHAISIFEPADDRLRTLIADWLVGPLYPAGARWYVELVNSTEGFYATAEDPVEALQQTLSYYNLTDAALIRKIERVQEQNHG